MHGYATKLVATIPRMHFVSTYTVFLDYSYFKKPKSTDSKPFL